MYYAPNEPEESVLAMGSDAKNEILITGDTKGYLSTWNIATYCSSKHSEVRSMKNATIHKVMYNRNERNVDLYTLLTEHQLCQSCSLHELVTKSL